MATARVAGILLHPTSLPGRYGIGELGSEAIAFVDRLAEVAEAENHNPDIDIRYRRVRVRWTTHSSGGITDLDRELAARTDELV